MARIKSNTNLYHLLLSAPLGKKTADKHSYGITFTWYQFSKFMVAALAASSGRV